jgi:hypothetical protein
MTIFRDKEKKEPKVEFSYPQSEALAQMIVQAWTDEKFRERLLDRKNAKEILAERGFFFAEPRRDHGRGLPPRLCHGKQK